MWTAHTFCEPMTADDVVTPAMLPPSAASLTTRRRSLFNDVLKAIKARQRVREIYSGSVSVVPDTGMVLQQMYACDWI